MSFQIPVLTVSTQLPIAQIRRLQQSIFSPYSDRVELRFGLNTTYLNQATQFAERESSRIASAASIFYEAQMDFELEMTPERRRRMNQAKAQYERTFSSVGTLAELNELMVHKEFTNLPRPVKRSLEEIQAEYYRLGLRPEDPPNFQNKREQIQAKQAELTELLFTNEETEQFGEVIPEGYDKPFAELLLDLIKDRNALARMRQQPDFYTMTLEATRLEGEELDSMLTFLRAEMDRLSDRLDQVAQQLYPPSQRARLTRSAMRIARTIHQLAKTDQPEQHPYKAYVSNALVQLDHFYQEHQPQMRRLLDKSAESIAQVRRRTSIPADGDIGTDTNSAYFELEQIMPHGRDAIRVLRDTAAGFGFSSSWVEDIIRHTDFRPRKGKNPGGLASAINPPFDVRILTNIPDAQLTLAQTRGYLLHEVLFHGVDAKCLNPKLPAILRSHDSMTTEAFAVMLEQVLYDPDWIQTVLKHPLTPTQKLDLSFDALEHIINRVRYTVAMVAFEKELYRNPDQNLDALYQEQISWATRYPKEKISNSPGTWATDLFHFTSDPVYYHNYLLGYLWAGQVKEALVNRFGSIYTPEAGRFLLENRSQGKLYTMEENLEKLTGSRELSPLPLIRELNQMADELLAEYRSLAVPKAR